MSLNVHVVVLAYKLVTELNSLLHVLKVPNATIHLVLHSQDKQVMEVCEFWKDESGVVYYPHGVNRGLGKSVNEGILAALHADADAIIVPNDDVIMTEFDFGRLTQACADHKDAGLIFCNEANGQSLAFHVFGINKIAFDAVGCFDESFPDYFCDTDYLRRCALLGVKIHNIGDTSIVHLGSATKNFDPITQKRLNITYPRDEAWYITKHGGVPGSETFVFPFNDVSLSWAIPAESRDNPYSEHQRLGLVP